MTGNEFIDQLPTTDEGNYVIYNGRIIEIHKYHNYCHIFSSTTRATVMYDYTYEETQLYFDVISKSLTEYTINVGITEYNIRVFIEYMCLEIRIIIDHEGEHIVVCRYNHFLDKKNNYTICDFLINVKSTLESLILDLHGNTTDILDKFTNKINDEANNIDKLLLKFYTGGYGYFGTYWNDHFYIHRYYNSIRIPATRYYDINTKILFDHPYEDIETYFEEMNKDNSLIAYNIGKAKVVVELNYTHYFIKIFYDEISRRLICNIDSPLREFLIKAKSVFELIGPNIGEPNVFDNFTRLMKCSRPKNAAK